MLYGVGVLPYNEFYVKCDTMARVFAVAKTVTNQMAYTACFMDS